MLKIRTCKSNIPCLPRNSSTQRNSRWFQIFEDTIRRAQKIWQKSWLRTTHKHGLLQLFSQVRSLRIYHLKKSSTRNDVKRVLDLEWLQWVNIFIRVFFCPKNWGPWQKRNYYPFERLRTRSRMLCAVLPSYFFPLQFCKLPKCDFEQGVSASNQNKNFNLFCLWLVRSTKVYAKKSFPNSCQLPILLTWMD